MDEVKEKYLKWGLMWLTKMYDSRYHGILESVKVHDGMIKNVLKELKSESIPQLERKD